MSNSAVFAKYSAGYAPKNVLLFVSRICFSQDSLIEVLRLAVGLASGLVKHNVAVVFIGDGAVQALAEHNTEACAAYARSAAAHGISFSVDKSSLSLRGLKPEQVITGFSIVSREDIMKMLEDSHTHLRL